MHHGTRHHICKLRITVQRTVRDKSTIATCQGSRQYFPCQVFWLHSSYTMSNIYIYTMSSTYTNSVYSPCINACTDVLGVWRVATVHHLNLQKFAEQDPTTRLHFPVFLMNKKYGEHSTANGAVFLSSATSSFQKMH